MEIIRKYENSKFLSDYCTGMVDAYVKENPEVEYKFAKHSIMTLTGIAISKLTRVWANERSVSRQSIATLLGILPQVYDSEDAHAVTYFVSHIVGECCVVDNENSVISIEITSPLVSVQYNNIQRNMIIKKGSFLDKLFTYFEIDVDGVRC